MFKEIQNLHNLIAKGFRFGNPGLSGSKVDLPTPNYTVLSWKEYLSYRIKNTTKNKMRILSYFLVVEGNEDNPNENNGWQFIQSLVE